MNWGNYGFANNGNGTKYTPQMFTFQPFPSISYYSFPNMSGAPNYVTPTQNFIPVFQPP